MHPQPPVTRGHSAARAGAVFWALAPLFTCGLATPFTMGWAAIYKRSWLQGLATAGYGGLLGAAFVWESSLGWALFANLVIGLIHGLCIMGWVFNLDAPAPVPTYPGATLVGQQQAVLAHYADVEQARQQARQLFATFPQRAHELAIGRPDIADRQFPDGGLVDVNRVPAEVFSSHLGLPAQVGDYLVAVRAQCGGFSSYDEMLVVSQLDHRFTDPIAGLLVFSPHR